MCGLREMGYSIRSCVRPRAPSSRVQGWEQTEELAWVAHERDCWLLRQRLASCRAHELRLPGPPHEPHFQHRRHEPDDEQDPCHSLALRSAASQAGVEQNEHFVATSTMTTAAANSKAMTTRKGSSRVRSFCAARRPPRH